YVRRRSRSCLARRGGHGSDDRPVRGRVQAGGNARRDRRGRGSPFLGLLVAAWRRGCIELEPVAGSSVADLSPAARKLVDDEQTPARFRPRHGPDASRDPGGSPLLAITNDHLETTTGPSGPDPDALIRPQGGMPDAVRYELRDQEPRVVPDVGRQPQRVERSAYVSQRAQVGRDAQLQPPGRPVRRGHTLLPHLRITTRSPSCPLPTRARANRRSGIVRDSTGPIRGIACLRTLGRERTR